MLINFSNHPSELWSKEQLDAARGQFGRVLDMPFPPVEPEADLWQVEMLAEQCLQNLLELVRQYPDEMLAVHVMGEHNLCFQLVDRLRKNGIRCLASTTKRNVVQTAEGKLSKFQFVRFRDYYSFDAPKAF